MYDMSVQGALFGGGSNFVNRLSTLANPIAQGTQAGLNLGSALMQYHAMQRQEDNANYLNETALQNAYARNRMQGIQDDLDYSKLMTEARGLLVPVVKDAKGNALPTSIVQNPNLYSNMREYVDAYNLNSQLNARNYQQGRTPGVDLTSSASWTNTQPNVFATQQSGSGLVNQSTYGSNKG